ncbi:MAG: DUF362 domain-containing protein [Anaerolineae bacterium]
MNMDKHIEEESLQSKDTARRGLSRRSFLQGLGATIGALLAGCRAVREEQAEIPAATVEVATPKPSETPTATAEAVPSTPSETPTPTATPPAEESAVEAGSSGGIDAALSNAPNVPIGTARGIHPGRVVWVHDPAATSWDGREGFWWEDRHLPPDVVSRMLSDSIQTLTGEGTNAAAWGALFRHYNVTHNRSDAGYRAGETIAIKLNLNSGTAHDQRDNATFTSPQLVSALLRQLVEEVGVPAEAITAYDAIRLVPDAIYEPCAVAPLEGVHFVEWEGGVGREQYARDLARQVHWSSQDVQGNPTYLPTCVTEADYLINVASLKGHNLAGVTLCAKNHLGSICCDLDGEPTQTAPQGAGIHGTIAAHDYGGRDPEWTWKQRPYGTYSALVDLMAHPDLGEKTVLFLLDAFYVAQHQSVGVEPRSRWQSAPFSGDWTSSLFASQDGVAIDSAGADFLRAEPTIAALPNVLPPHSTYDNYLHEAALIDQPPSGTAYGPTGERVTLTSLGVHEHWNNAQEKAYTRNLGTGEGIELVRG